MKNVKNILVILVIFTNHLMAQSDTYRHHLSIIAYDVILGKGDYRSFMLQNQYGFQLFPFLESTARIGFLTAYRGYEEGSTYHLQHHIMGELSVNLIPVVIAKRVYLKLGGGFSIRHRQEATAGKWYLEDRQEYINWLFNEENSWDVGYHMQTMLGVNIGKRWFSEGKVYLAFYDRGTQVAKYGLGVGYRF